MFLDFQHHCKEYEEYQEPDIPTLVNAYKSYVQEIDYRVFGGLDVTRQQQTLENIKKGNPVAVYKSGSNWGSFIGITLNNLYVGARCYLYGVFGGIGTFYIFLQNSLMLGSFQYFFYQQGVFWKSVRGIWIHGSMEIFAIVIESTAGFILGASILFPKTYSRINSFKIGFKNSFKIFLSTIPFTIAAGFLEGFITRYSIEMENWFSSFIILFTLALISFYYLIYPFIVHKKTLPA